jgi:hypothetical protein
MLAEIPTQLCNLKIANIPIPYADKTNQQLIREFFKTF